MSRHETPDNLPGENHDKIRVRLAKITDINTIFAIRLSVRENQISRARLTEMGITAVAIRDAILASPCVWIAEIGQIPAGFSMACTAEASVFALFIRPEFEGLGLGRVLLANAETYLFKHHQKIWLVTDGNSRASGFYRQLGWHPKEYLADGDIRFEKSV
ncbi:GNAT family N-acetyltransferase [Sodalis sp. C49]|uniref:GNAT family N-acetyltransferase n=1 Tax=Sodalis sp. C49 TaxID=3228929 RepID=UPI003965A4E4